MFIRDILAGNRYLITAGPYKGQHCVLTNQVPMQSSRNWIVELGSGEYVELDCSAIRAYPQEEA